MEAGLRLDDHREILRQAVNPTRVCELPNKRPNGDVDELGRGRTAGDHEHIRVEVARVRELAQPGDGTWIDVLHRDPQLSLETRPSSELGRPLLRRRQEEVADLLEERRFQPGEEPRAGLGKPYLRRGRELLPDPAHRLARRARRHLRAVAEHDSVLRATQGEVIGDARPDRAGAGYDDSSHCSTSARSSGVRPRNGGRTTSWMGTPRRAITVFNAAWNGKRSRNTRFEGSPPSGKAAARPETLPAAPRSTPASTSDSAPMNTSSPSRRYGSTASSGWFETLSPATRSPSRSTTGSGIE